MSVVFVAFREKWASAMVAPSSNRVAVSTLVTQITILIPVKLLANIVLYTCDITLQIKSLVYMSPVGSVNQIASTTATCTISIKNMLFTIETDAVVLVWGSLLNVVSFFNSVQATINTEVQSSKYFIYCTVHTYLSCNSTTIAYLRLAEVILILDYYVV